MLGGRGVQELSQLLFLHVGQLLLVSLILLFCDANCRRQREEQT